MSPQITPVCQTQSYYTSFQNCPVGGKLKCPEAITLWYQTPCEDCCYIKTFGCIWCECSCLGLVIDFHVGVPRGACCFKEVDVNRCEGGLTTVLAIC